MLVADWIKGLPIRLAVAEDGLIDWRNGAMTIYQMRSLNEMGSRIQNMMYGHELGHILAATDAQLRMPNIGLPSQSALDRANGVPRLTLSREEVRRTETMAVAAHYLFEPADTASDRSLKAAKSLFGVTREDVDAWLAAWNLERLHNALSDRLKSLA